jgi:hypothetical protein
MVCGIGSTLPANRTAATAEVMPSVLDEMHFIGCRKAASLAGRAKLKPEPEPGPEPKPNAELEHESEPDMRAPATLLLIQPLFLLQKSTHAHPAWQHTHTRVTRGYLCHNRQRPLLPTTDQLGPQCTSTTALQDWSRLLIHQESPL